MKRNGLWCYINVRRRKAEELRGMRAAGAELCATHSCNYAPFVRARCACVCVRWCICGHLFCFLTFKVSSSRTNDDADKTVILIWMAVLMARSKISGHAGAGFARLRSHSLCAGCIALIFSILNFQQIFSDLCLLHNRNWMNIHFAFGQSALGWSTTQQQ